MSPIEKYLGREALERGTGAFALLGVTPDTCTDDRVIASLEWQLDRVAQHPEGDTPEADEVRLALHAAAAQLLDRNVRQHLLRQSSRDGNGSAPALPVLGPTAAAAAAAAVAKAATGAASTPDVQPVAPVPSVPSPAPPASPAPALEAPGVAPVAGGLEREALVTLAQYGGWNKRSLAHLAALAHARGLPPRAVAQSLRNLATKRRHPRPSQYAPPRGAPPRPDAAAPHRLQGQWRGPSSSGGLPPEPAPLVMQPALSEHDPAQRLLRNLVIGATIAIVTIVGALVLAMVLSPEEPPPAAPKLAAIAPSDDSPADPKGTTEAGTPAGLPKPTASARNAPTPASSDAQKLVDPQAVVRSLRDAAESVAKGPDEAVAKFEPALRALATRWARFDPAQRRAADAAVIDFVFRTRGWPDASARALDAISTGAEALVAASSDAADTGQTLGDDAVWAGVWSVGLLTRLSRERELPTGISARVEAELTRAIGEDRPRLDASFEAGAMAVLRRMPARLLRTAPKEGDKPLSAWIDAVAAVCGPDVDLRERVLVDGLEQVMTQGADPVSDRRVFAAIQQLAVQIKWRKGGAARPRLLDWFRDHRITNADLQVLTSALATQSSAEGVDPLMILTSGASAGDRQKLRSAYARAWGLAEAASRDKLAEEWVRAARRLFYVDLAAQAPLENLATAATMSELNEAATRLWRGETDAAKALLETVGQAAEKARQVAPGKARTLGGASDADGQWAVKFLSAGQNIPIRLERLAEAENSGMTLGAVDAEVAAEQACFATPAEVRRGAQKVVEKYADEPVMINAMLEVLPRAPRYTSVGETYERVAMRTLPRVTDADWELHARRALVERLLDMLGTGNEEAAIDALASLIWDSYARRAGVPEESAGGSSKVEPAQQGLRAAVSLWLQWRAEGEASAPNEYAPVALDAIDRRHDGRVSLADGCVQAFAAQQAGVAELMAYVTTAERPSRAPKARDIIQEMGAARRASTHIFAQLAATERAMLELWMLRLSEGGQ